MHTSMKISFHFIFISDSSNSIRPHRVHSQSFEFTSFAGLLPLNNSGVEMFDQQESLIAHSTLIAITQVLLVRSIVGR